MKRQAPVLEDETQEENATSGLERNVELANVTELRQNLLPIINELQQDPAQRFLILKRGKPQAVLMSVQTYQLMKKVFDQVAEQAAGMTREERIESAVDRLRSERLNHSKATSANLKIDSPKQVTEQVTKQIEAMLTMLQQIQNTLEQSSKVEVVKQVSSAL